MRFVLYIFTWLFVVTTIGALVQGDTEQFVTGLFLSGLMVWWSKSVRDRRRRRLNGDDPRSKSRKSHPSDSKPISDEVTSAAERANREIDNAKSEISNLWAASKEEARKEIQKAKEEVRKEAQKAKESAERFVTSVQAQVEKSEAPQVEEPLANNSEQTSALHNPDETETPEPTSLPQESSPKEEVQVETARPDRPTWKDSQGKSLHVGAKVTFLANSKGQSVSIPGVLLGERDGQALIEVASGALLPRNDYSIPWSVVTAVD